MSRILVAIILGLSLAACSRHVDNTDDESAGTRGGGDACELDYHAQLNYALTWLKGEGQAFLTAEQIELIKPLTTKKMDEISVHCLNEPIVLGNVPKTAVTQIKSNGTVETQIDSRRWDRSAFRAKAAIAVHEILIMLGIEKTNDYHISNSYSDPDWYPLVSTLECSKRAFGGETFGLNITLNEEDSANPGPSYKIDLLFGEKHLTIASAANCFFSGQDMLLFDCHDTDPVTHDPRSTVMMELVTTSYGPELRIYPQYMNAAVAVVKVLNDLMNQFFPLRLSSVKDLAYTLSWTLEDGKYDAEDPNFTQCKIQEAN